MACEYLDGVLAGARATLGSAASLASRLAGRWRRERDPRVALRRLLGVASGAELTAALAIVDRAVAEAWIRG